MYRIVVWAIVFGVMGMVVADYSFFSRDVVIAGIIIGLFLGSLVGYILNTKSKEQILGYFNPATKTGSYLYIGYVFLFCINFFELMSSPRNESAIDTVFYILSWLAILYSLFSIRVSLESAHPSGKKIVRIVSLLFQWFLILAFGLVTILFIIKCFKS